MGHMTTPEAEALLDVFIPVLDKGHVRLCDWMGGDARVVDAARVSYQTGTKTLNEDRALINYLLSHLHTTPFEKVRFEFHVKLPIFIARQWMRHRMGSYNELSARYSIMPDEFYIPFPKGLRTQSEQNKQVGEGQLTITNSVIAIEKLRKTCKEAYIAYEELLNLGVCREQARMALPVNIYTEFYWTIDLWNLMHFLRLRLDWHAQKEIRDYAFALAQCVQAVAPISYAAFEEHVVHAQRFSKKEQLILKQLLIEHDAEKVKELAGSYLTKRPLADFEKKIQAILDLQ
jgi:thymidylate synthase (FAD)